MKNIFILVAILALAGCKNETSQFEGTWKETSRGDGRSITASDRSNLIIKRINDNDISVEHFSENKSNSNNFIFRAQNNEPNIICSINTGFCLRYDPTVKMICDNKDTYRKTGE